MMPWYWVLLIGFISVTESNIPEIGHMHFEKCLFENRQFCIFVFFFSEEVRAVGFRVWYV